MVDEDFRSIPSITLDTDDIAERRNQRPTSGHRSGEKFVSNKLNPVYVKVGLTMLSVLLLTAVAMIVYLGKQLKLTQQNLVDATNRIGQLELRLVSTDTTITKSEVLLAAKLKSIDELGISNKVEIRKLWGGYEKTSHAIDAAAVEIKNHQDNLKEMKPQLLQLNQQVVVNSELLKNIDGSVKEIDQRVELIQENVSNLSDSQKIFKEKLVAVDADSGRRLSALEDTAKSTDVFRRNTQDELRKLKEELIQQGQMAGSKTQP